VQTVSFETASLSIAKTERDLGFRVFTFTVQRTGGTTGDVDFSGSFSGGGTDAADFGGLGIASFSGTILAGQSTATIRIKVSGDTDIEGDEAFTLTLQSATNASATAVLGGTATLTAKGTIINDDVVHTHIANGETVTDFLLMTSSDTLAVDEGGTLSVSGDAIYLMDPLHGAVIDNAGLVEGANSAIVANVGLNGPHTFTILNRETGVIRADGDAIVGETGRGGRGHVVIDNAGLIESTTDGAIDIRKLHSESVTIINRETGVMSGRGDVVRPGYGSIQSVKVLNDGLIVSPLDPSDPFAEGGDGVDFQESGGTLVNGATGVMDAGRHGITGNRPVTVINAEGGVISGRNGSGVNLDTGADTTSVVKNHGLISGNYNGGGSGDGDGVDVDGLVSIVNDGRIEGTGADDFQNFADGIAAGGGTIHNLAGGEIYGEARAILIDDSDLGDAFAATRIVNSGSISSFSGPAIKMIGNWDDTIVNAGTIISGAGIAIDMGGGNDKLVLREGSLVAGTMMLGDGDDTARGSDGNERIDGGAGADFIASGGGSDVLTGGADGDTFFFSGADVHGTDIATITDISFEEGDVIRLTGFASGTFHGIPGINPLAVNADGSAVTINSFTDLKELDDASDAVEINDPGTGALYISIAVAPGDVRQIRLADAGDDYEAAPEPTDIIGTSDSDTLKGQSGSEQLYGLDGNDRLQGNGGDDVLVGGAGSDTFVFRGSDVQGAFWTDIDDVIFAEGDKIELSGFATGTFIGQDGGNPLQITGAGRNAVIDSMDDLVELDLAAAAVDVSRLSSTNHARVTIDNGGGDVHVFVIDNAWAAYVAAGGL